MSVRKAQIITGNLTDVALLTVPDGGHTYSLGINAVTALGAFVAADAGTATIEFLSGVNDRWEPLLDPAGAQVSVSLVAPVTISAAGGIRAFRATPAGLVGATVAGMRLLLWSFDGAMAPVGGGSVTLQAGDVEIGAVELKNDTTDDRAKIVAANSASAATDKVLRVQNISADGSVGVPLPTGAATAVKQDNILTQIETLEIQGDAIAAGATDLTAVNQSLDIDLGDGRSALAIDIRGTFSATFAFEHSLDGVLWYPLGVIQHLQNTATIFANVAGRFFAPVGGLKWARVRVAQYTSGTVTAYMRATHGDFQSLAEIASALFDIRQRTPELELSAAPVMVDYTDRSGSIAAGGTSQQLAPAAGTTVGTRRVGFFFQNISNSDMWLHEGSAAVIGASGHFQIPGGASVSFESVTPQSWHVICQNAGRLFTCKEQLA